MYYRIYYLCFYNAEFLQDYFAVVIQINWYRFGVSALQRSAFSIVKPKESFPERFIDLSNITLP